MTDCVQLGNWLVKVETDQYNIWVSPDDTKAIVEFLSDKIAVLALGENREIKTQSINAYIKFDPQNHTIAVAYTGDNNIGSSFNVY